MSKIIAERAEAKDVPKKDATGRNLTVERVKVKASESDPGKAAVIATVPGLTIEADDNDDAGLLRALSTLTAMVPG